jgi:hypothetical protein
MEVQTKKFGKSRKGQVQSRQIDSASVQTKGAFPGSGPTIARGPAGTQASKLWFIQEWTGAVGTSIQVCYLGANAAKVTFIL